MQLSLIVCCMFSIGNGPRRYGHLLELLLNSRWINTIATGFQQQRHRGTTFTISSVVPHDVHRSLISTECLLQVHHSPISSVCHIVAHRSPISTVSLLQVRRSLISSVCLIKCTIPHSPACASSSAPFTNRQCYTFYKGCTNLHCCTSTVAPFYSVAPFVS